jgi:hypothetical protein
MHHLSSALPEGKRLFVLDKLHAERLESISSTRQRRQALAQRIADCAQGGKVAVIENGRDCDGVQYWGQRHLIDASIAAFTQLEDGIARYADGPFGLFVVPPSEAVERGSRDLTLEAFEDGHAHVLYAGLH